MHPFRILILTLGPVALLWGAYFASHAPSLGAWSAVEAEEADAVAEDVLAPSEIALPLPVACREAAARLRSRCGDELQVVIAPPFVIAGDASRQALERYYQRTILPVVDALNASYFDRRPDRPIVIVVLSSEDRYHTVAEKLDGRSAAAYYGYYQRKSRRIVLNQSTGDGTLAHELTHALAHCDFPDMPEWFDEGLAALHEEADFSPNGREIVGLHNWRLKLLQPALERNRLPSLEIIVQAENDFRGEGEGLHYATVRYFCMYLQQQGLLAKYYREFRDHAAGDPTGAETLLRVLNAESLAEVDARFHAWLRQVAG